MATIVVATIAILAAIAVSNFLEAQTRAKVSRVHADMRSLATGIESYAVNYNRAPMGEGQIKYLDRQGHINVPSGDRLEYAYSTFTTPVSYTTSIPGDPFTFRATLREKLKLYNYEAPFKRFDGKWANRRFVIAYAMGYNWALASVGPSAGRVGFNNGLALAAENNPNYMYDATNGTTSFGHIVGANKGILIPQPK